MVVNEPVDPDPGHAAEPDRAAAERRRQARRRRELDQMFGEVLPETTRDESGPDGRANGPSDRDRWYSENRPPHHG